MTPGQAREFAAAVLVDTQGRLLLQLRDDIAGIVYPGKVGLFGGHREGDETFLQCICREIHEEIGLLLPPERFEWMASYSGVGYGGGRVAGAFFVAHNIPVDVLEITEGSLLIVARDDLPSLVPRLTPTAWLALRIFINGGSCQA